MDNQTTKIYENTTGQTINVLGVGEIPAHDRITVRAEFHAPVNLANYPGVVDVLAQEAAGTPAVAPDPASHTEYTESEKDALKKEQDFLEKYSGFGKPTPPPAEEIDLGNPVPATAPAAPTSETPAAPTGNLQIKKNDEEPKNV